LKFIPNSSLQPLSDKESSQVTFCFCGLVAINGGKCNKHQGIDKVKKNKIKKYSGYSKYREENGEFQAIWRD